MPFPPFLHRHPPGTRLYLDLERVLNVSDLADHTATLALRGVLHAAAWLDADPLLDPFHATVSGGQIHYHHRNDKQGFLAADVHRAVLFNGPVLSCTGMSVRAALSSGASEACLQRASSEWRQLLRLNTRHGLNFQRFTLT